MADPVRPGPTRGRTAARRRPLRGLLFALVALPVLVTVLLGLMAAYVGGGGWWLVQLIAIGLPYAAWAAAALALVALATRRPGWALLLAAPVLLVALRAWPGTVHAPAASDLVVTTFNVPQNRDLRATLGDSAVAFAARTAPHLLALQDVWVYPAGTRGEQPVHVRALVEREAYRIAVPVRLNPREGWQRRGMGTPLLVRETPRPSDSATDSTAGPGSPPVEVLDQEEVSLGRDDDVSLALRTRFRWRGREAVLYNVHLRSYGEPKPWTDPSVAPLRPSTWRPYLGRYRSVFADRHAETDRLAERIAAETLPVLIVGDFNSTADHYTVRRLKQARAGRPFVDAYARTAGWRWGRTYHAERPLVRIDFVLVDPEAFEIARARTYAVGFSDHRPVEVRLRWREAAPADTTR